MLSNMPETDLEPVLEILISRVGKGYDPEDARPDDIVDDWGNLSALRRASSARKLNQLDEAEIAEFGETLGESIKRRFEDAPLEDEEISAEEEAAVQEARDELAADMPTVPLEEIKRKYELK